MGMGVYQTVMLQQQQQQTLTKQSDVNCFIIKIYH